MSAVELAQRSVDDASFVRFVVIKRIHQHFTDDDAFIRMFQDEARISAELQHENIAQVYDFGRHDEEYYLAMEYIPGMDLRGVQRALHKAQQPLPLRVTLRILADVSAALEYAHTRVDTFGQPMRIVHRDVNPRNIMISTRGEVKLIDFGVAKAETRLEKTQGHAIKGKFAYMAPEQIEAAADLDGRADIYAMGLVLHELIAGSSPFIGLTEVQIMHRVLAGRIPGMGAIPDHPQPEMLHSIHRRALAVIREDRYPSAAALRADLIAAAEPIGGLMSRSELSTFIRGLSEDAEEWTGKLRAYSEQSISRVTMPPQTTDPQDDTGGTLAEAPTRAHPGLPTDASYAPQLDAATTIDRSAISDLTVAEPAPRRKWLIFGVIATFGALLLMIAAGLGWIGLQMNKDESVETAPAAVVTDTPARRRDNTPTEPPSGIRPTETVETTEAPTTREAPRVEGPATVSATRTAPQETTEAGASPPVSTEALPAGTPPAGTPPAGTQRTGTQPEESPTEEPPTEEPPTEEPAEAPAAVQMAHITVSSRPEAASGYEVWVDGARIGDTPLRRSQIPVGQHHLEIRTPDGSRSWAHDFDLALGDSLLITPREVK